MSAALGFTAALAALAVTATVVVRIVERAAQAGRASALTPGIAVWLLYFLHAQTVAAAAFGGVGQLPLPPAPVLAVGAATGLAGWLLFAAATGTLVRHGGFVGVGSSRLVAVGPFRISRHPQNAGWTMLLLGIAVASRSVVAFVFVAAFALVTARLARIEEDDLERRHGSAYTAYRDATPLVLGPPSRRAAG